MTTLPTSPCSATPVRYGAVTTLALALAADRMADQAAAPQGPAALGASPVKGPGAVPGCGWFESSWDLQHGLMVSELPDRDGAAAALWFSAVDSASGAAQDSTLSGDRRFFCPALAQLQ